MNKIVNKNSEKAKSNQYLFRILKYLKSEEAMKKSILRFVLLLGVVLGGASWCVAQGTSFHGNIPTGESSTVGAVPFSPELQRLLQTFAVDHHISFAHAYDMYTHGEIWVSSSGTGMTSANTPPPRHNGVAGRGSVVIDTIEDVLKPLAL